MPAPSEPSILIKAPTAALPDSLIFPHNAASFKQSMEAYWAQQECEVEPACVLRPRDTQ